MIDLFNDRSYKFQSNLLSRVKNFSLVPSLDNALIPLFEAVTNSNLQQGAQDEY